MELHEITSISEWTHVLESVLRRIHLHSLLSWYQLKARAFLFTKQIFIDSTVSRRNTTIATFAVNSNSQPISLIYIATSSLQQYQQQCRMIFKLQTNPDSEASKPQTQVLQRLTHVHQILSSVDAPRNDYHSFISSVWKTLSIAQLLLLPVNVVNYLFIE